MGVGQGAKSFYMSSAAPDHGRVVASCPTIIYVNCEMLQLTIVAGYGPKFVHIRVYAPKNVSIGTMAIPSLAMRSF